MKSIKCILLISTCLLLPKESQAEINLTFDVSNLSLSNPTLHTHTPNVELKPISVSNSGVKLAAVCALAKGGCDDVNFNLDNSAQCKDEGFMNSCSVGYCMDKSCPYTNNYGKCITENCPTNSSPTCTGAVAGKDACGNDCKKCCVTSCPSGYTYKTIPNGYLQDGEPCMHCTEGAKYKIKINPCDGYLKCDYGPAAGASSCLSGSTNKYDNCRPCDEGCPYGTSNSDPGGCGGYTRNECNTKNCYYTYKSCWTHYDDHSDCAGGAYYCNSTCSSCGACTGCGYDSCYGVTAVTCSSNQTCASTDCGKCQSCRAKTCAKDGYNDCGAGYSCVGNACKVACNETCSGQTSSCSSNQIQTSSCSLKCGSGTRYSCRTATCSDGGYVSSCPSGQSGTAVYYKGNSCYSGCKSACIPNKSSTCTSSQCSEKCGDGCGGTITCCSNKTYSQSCYNSCYSAQQSCRGNDCTGEFNRCMYACPKNTCP